MPLNCFKLLSKLDNFDGILHKKSLIILFAREYGNLIAKILPNFLGFQEYLLKNGLWQFIDNHVLKKISLGNIKCDTFRISSIIPEYTYLRF